MSALAIPTGGLSSEATDILRRLEPLLLEIVAEQKRQGADIATLKTDVATLKTDVATLKTDVATLKTEFAQMRVDIIRVDKELAGVTGRVSQVPNIWQLITVSLAFYSALVGAIAAIRYLF